MAKILKTRSKFLRETTQCTTSNSKERRRETPNRTPLITPQHPIVTSPIFNGDSAVFMIQWTDYSFLKITLNFHHKETELDLNRY